MKKIICALAIAVTAFVANAASVNWSGLGGTLATTGDTATTYSVYLVNSSVFASASDAVTSIMGGSSDGVLATTAGITAGTGFRFGVTGGELAGTWGAGDVINAYAIILDGSTATADNYMATAAKNATVSAAGVAQFAYGSMASLSWNEVPTADIPEPTSGLLLLVGVAGLALRRKKA